MIPLISLQFHSFYKLEKIYQLKTIQISAQKKFIKYKEFY